MKHAGVLALDIGSNSVGSAWIDRKSGTIVTGTSVFPAGVDETDDKRGDPKNAKRRMTRRTRITLARRAHRKRELRIHLIDAGLLPKDESGFKELLEASDPWELRRRALDGPLSPHEFGRVLLHLSQRRGALGLRIVDPDDPLEAVDDAEDGRVKAAIGAVRKKMLDRKARTFGEFIAMVRADRTHAIEGPDHRRPESRVGVREFRDPVRNRAGNYEHCADRAMIRDEFARLWDKQRSFGGPTARMLSDDLRQALDNERGDSIWKHKGLLFGQRRQTWNLGTLGRCVLEPTERCAPHADMYASRFLVVETVNNLKILERGRPPRPLTPDERSKIKAYLSGPLGMERGRKRKGQREEPPDRPKTTVSVTDLRELMGWGRATKATQMRFNIEADEDRLINTDWFSREIVHGAITLAKWSRLSDSLREGINRALLRLNPDEDGDAERLRTGLRAWGGLDPTQAEAVVVAWTRRPKLDAKRLNMSRRAVRNLLAVMDRNVPWPDPADSSRGRWLTQIEARKLIASDADFLDVTTGLPLDNLTRLRYATGAKGLTARDRYYLRKHGGELPPAPMLSNPVVRKAIHEVRRHVMEYMRRFGGPPAEIYIELAREARMGAKESDRALLKNRLRNRIRNDIADAFDLRSRTSTQQRAATDRVVLCMQQGGRCPLCGEGGLTDRMAANGDNCEVAHIIPRASGGHNGMGNLVLAHTKCNRDMARRTPRQFWTDTRGFDTGMRWVEGIYGEVCRPKPGELRSAQGPSLWSAYFTSYDDKAKVEQFKKDIKDIQDMTQRQEAATKYAARQVMTYLADALFDGKGLPERGGERRIFATDGRWTSRLRREWALFFDPHDARAKGLSNSDEHERKEKNRGDHRHHAIDAIVIGYCTRQVQLEWEQRERDADVQGINTADEEAMENYRRLNRLNPPHPYTSIDDFREAVRAAVFGQGELERPICHRPVKRKIVGALHEETLLGPVLDRAGTPTNLFTAKKSVLALDPNHLRMPRPETEREAVERLAARRVIEKDIDDRAAKKWAREFVASKAFHPAFIDPPPGKSGIVRDIALRARLRECLNVAGLDPDNFSANQIKKLAEAGAIRQASGVPIKTVVLLRTMSDPVLVGRRRPDYASGKMGVDADPASLRAYVGGNNHHIEIRVDARGDWTGEIVSAFEAAQRNLERLRALRKMSIPKPKAFRELPKSERVRLKPILAGIEAAHPIVDRSDDPSKGGAFVMSLCEGEMLYMLHKVTRRPGYFVVAKLDKPRSIVLVPHWDARAAGERQDAEGRKVPDSRRDQFAVSPVQLKELAPPGHAHAQKVRVTPLGAVTFLDKD